MHINRFATSAAALVFLVFASPAAADDTIGEVRNALYDARSVWQVYCLEVE